MNTLGYYTVYIYVYTCQLSVVIVANDHQQHRGSYESVAILKTLNQSYVTALAEHNCAAVEIGKGVVVSLAGDPGEG